jgi:hypothetical protein
MTTRVRQYEDINSTPAAAAFFAEHTPVTTIIETEPRNSGSAPPPPPPAASIADVISTLLHGRADALVIIDTVSRSLGLPPQAVPGQASPSPSGLASPGQASTSLNTSDAAEIRPALAHWRESACAGRPPLDPIGPRLASPVRFQESADVGPAGPTEPHFSAAPILAIRADLVRSFAQWYHHVKSARRLRRLTASFHAKRASRAPSEPEIVTTSTWAERDAALRSSAVSITTSHSSQGEDSVLPFDPALRSCKSLAGLPQNLPFCTPSDLPPALGSHRDSPVIAAILESRPDLSHAHWRRRVLYTKENWAEWALWSNAPSQPHRERMAAGLVFSDPAKILNAPSLRSPAVETAADAWNVYRRHLIITIRAALVVGYPWTEILVCLSATYADQERGYPRLLNYIKSALTDTVLIKYPLLHADVLLYKLDQSFASGSRKYSRNSITIDWEQAVSRQHGEDPQSLAIRVTGAYITMRDDDALTDVNVWDKPTFAREINQRFADCLSHDLGNPKRGAANYDLFMTKWREAQALNESDPTLMPMQKLSCERLANLYVTPFETTEYSSAERTAAPVQPPGLPQLRHASRQTGQGARDRRAERRAHLQTYQEEPPPY